MRIITGRARGLQLNTPKNMDVRPTADRVKESVFNIIGNKIVQAQVVDFFAGTGNLGLESWSRGAAGITFIDLSRESLRIVESNILKCKAQEDCSVIKGNAVQVIERLYQQGKRFDFAFCDPPYKKGWLQQIVNALEKYHLLQEGGYLVMERSPQEEITCWPQGYELIRSVKYGDTVVDFIMYSNVVSDKDKNK